MALVIRLRRGGLSRPEQVAVGPLVAAGIGCSSSPPWRHRRSRFRWQLPSASSARARARTRVPRSTTVREPGRQGGSARQACDECPKRFRP
jgi:hypothetical protein